jgi:hypothetical protein
MLRDKLQDLRKSKKYRTLGNAIGGSNNSDISMAKTIMENN